MYGLIVSWDATSNAAVMIVGGLRFLPNVGEPRRIPLDLVSIPVSAVGFGGLVYGLSTDAPYYLCAAMIALVIPVAWGIVRLRDAELGKEAIA